MQQKFNIGDKVKVLTIAYPDAYGTEGVITNFGHGNAYIVERNATDYPSDQYGHFEPDSWRYCFYERELELVEDKPKTKFKVGDKVVCVRGNEYHDGFPLQGKHYVVTDTYVADGYEYVGFGGCDYSGWYVDRFELVPDQEVSNTEPSVQITVNVDENICAAFNEVKNGLKILLSGKPEPKCEFEVGNEVLLGGCLAEVVSVKQYDTATLIGVKQGSYYFIVSPEDLQHYKKEESEKVAENTQKLYQDLKESFEQLFADEPSYTIGQEVYVSNDFNRYLRKGVLLDAIPRNGLMHVNIGGFDCYVEEERVYTKEMKVRERE